MRQRRTSSRRPGGIVYESTRFIDYPDSYLTPLSDVAWKASSRCAGNGACVEVAQLSMGHIALRDGMNPEPGKIMIFTPQEWHGFIAGIKGSKPSST